MAADCQYRTPTTWERYLPPGFDISTATIETLMFFGNLIHNACADLAKIIVEDAKELKKKGQHIGEEHTKMNVTYFEAFDIVAKIAHELQQRGCTKDFTKNWM